MGTRTYSRRGADGIRRPTKLGISTGKFTTPIDESFMAREETPVLSGMQALEQIPYGEAYTEMYGDNSTLYWKTLMDEGGAFQDEVSNWDGGRPVPTATIGGQEYQLDDVRAQELANFLWMQGLTMTNALRRAGIFNPTAEDLELYAQLIGLPKIEYWTYYKDFEIDNVDNLNYAYDGREIDIRNFDLEIKREIEFNEYGVDIYVSNALLKTVQKGTGLGMDIVRAQMEAAQKLWEKHGIDIKIAVNMAQGGGYNGVSTWAKLGYDVDFEVMDGDLRAIFQEVISDYGFKPVNNTRDLMMQQNYNGDSGYELWGKIVDEVNDSYGYFSVFGNFVPSANNSGIDVLAQYMQSKRGS